MIDRDFRGGPINLRCDACAPEYCETGEFELAAALTVAKSEGWAVKHLGEPRGWAHFCPDCAADEPWTRADAVRPSIRQGKR